jgi:hypothetical protein
VIAHAIAFVLICLAVCLAWYLGYCQGRDREHVKHAALQKKFLEVRQQLDASSRASRTQKTKAKHARHELRQCERDRAMLRTALTPQDAK